MTTLRHRLGPIANTALARLAEVEARGRVLTSYHRPDQPKPIRWQIVGYTDHYPRTGEQIRNMRDLTGRVDNHYLILKRLDDNAPKTEPPGTMQVVGKHGLSDRWRLEPRDPQENA